jgi:hypothetical protein
MFHVKRRGGSPKLSRSACFTWNKPAAAAGQWRTPERMDRGQLRIRFLRSVPRPGSKRQGPPTRPSWPPSLARQRSACGKHGHRMQCSRASRVAHGPGQPDSCRSPYPRGECAPRGADRGKLYRPSGIRPSSSGGAITAQSTTGPPILAPSDGSSRPAPAATQIARATDLGGKRPSPASLSGPGCGARPGVRDRASDCDLRVHQP